MISAARVGGLASGRSILSVWRLGRRLSVPSGLAERIDRVRGNELFEHWVSRRVWQGACEGGSPLETVGNGWSPSPFSQMCFAARSVAPEAPRFTCGLRKASCRGPSFVPRRRLRPELPSSLEKSHSRRD